MRPQVGCAGLVDPDPFGKDRRRELRREREQRGVTAFAGALDPIALQAHFVALVLQGSSAAAVFDAPRCL